METIIFRWLDKLLRLDRLLELTGEDTDDYAPNRAKRYADILVGKLNALGI